MAADAPHQQPRLGGHPGGRGDHVGRGPQTVPARPGGPGLAGSGVGPSLDRPDSLQIVDHPFAPSNVSTVEIGTFAYLALLAAALVVVSGTVQAVTHKGTTGTGASGPT